MEKLTYKKTSDLTLDIDLHNGYSVRTDAIFNFDSKRYDVKFYIKENTISKYIEIETLSNEKVSFDGNRRTIKKDILRYVSCLLSTNYFNDPIKHYEYEIKCFDRGNNLYEEEKINDVKSGL